MAQSLTFSLFKDEEKVERLVGTEVPLSPLSLSDQELPPKKCEVAKQESPESFKGNSLVFSRPNL